MKIKEIEDKIGNKYLALSPDNDFVIMNQNILYSLLEDANVYIENQRIRDKGAFHITVIPVAECLKLKKENKDISFLIGKEIEDLSFLGIGKATKENNTSFFIIAESKKIQEIRCNLGLSENNLHVTIGFDKKDVHGINKSITSKISDLISDEINLIDKKYKL